MRTGAGKDEQVTSPPSGFRDPDGSESTVERRFAAMTARAAALPPMVKLDALSGVSIEDQLREVLTTHSVKLIDLFREWDDNGDGALDKKEMRQAIAALGYEAPRKVIDKFFDSIDDDENGWIEFGELKAALAKRPKPRPL